jgi:phenylacetate-CoA ligase
MRQLYLSANHISKANAPAYWEAIEEFRPTHLVTYASSAAALAKEFVDLRLRCSTLKVVLTNAEPLLLWQRELITATIAPVVRESYGMAETVAAASECAHGHLHFWPETGHIEVVADVTDDPAPSGTVGRLVSTGLLNRDMPLIRYLVGDRCSAPLWNEQCSCGRRLPTLPGIEGRTNDLLVTKDGRKVFWINPVFYGLPVGEAQVIQETLDEIRVCVVPSEGFSAGTEATIRARLCDRLGLVNVSVTKADSIPRGPNGKFRAVISKVG